jgi:hypothetical protein
MDTPGMQLSQPHKLPGNRQCCQQWISGSPFAGCLQVSLVTIGHRLARIEGCGLPGLLVLNLTALSARRLSPPIVIGMATAIHLLDIPLFVLTAWQG